MISKNQIKFLKSLHVKKIREEEKLFIVEGLKLVDELLHSNFVVVSVYSTEHWLNADREAVIRLKSIETNPVSHNELKAISSLSTPNEVLAVVRIPEYLEFSHAESNKLILALDGIQDPGNLGTIIRVADWFGLKTIVCSLNTVDVYNSKVVQASMGSITRVKVYYKKLEDFLVEKRSILPIYTAELGGENVYALPSFQTGILVLGNESKGVSPSISDLATKKIEIPRLGGAESLNVSIAAALICGEYSRRLLL